EVALGIADCAHARALVGVLGIALERQRLRGHARLSLARIAHLVVGAARSAAVLDGCAALPEWTAHPTLEVVDQADAGRALERAGLEVFLSDGEARECRIVLVLWSAGIAEPSRLAGQREDGHGAAGEQAEARAEERSHRCSSMGKRESSEW